MRYILFFLLFLLGNLNAQSSLRGLSVVNETTAWCSGSKGSVHITTDGKKWKDVSPKSYEQKDFRAIYAYDLQTALILSIGDSTVILRTIDGGENWSLAYENNTPGIFFDDFDIHGAKGFALADPLANGTVFHHPFIITNDSGKSWHPYLNRVFNDAHKDAGLFAASGSNVILDHDHLTAIVGGPQAYFLSTEFRKVALPIKSGGSFGPYSMDRYKKYFAVVGGNYAQKEYKDSIACYSKDNGKTWKPFKTMPSGYKSSIKFFNNGKCLVTVGSTGVDVSTNGGKTWKNIAKTGYNTVEVYGNSIWMVGNGGLKSRFEVKNLKKFTMPVPYKSMGNPDF